MGNIKKLSWMLQLDKYPYQNFSRESVDGQRLYNTGEAKVPSVTTILSATEDRSKLDAWIKRVG